MKWVWSATDRSWYDHSTPYHVHYWQEALPGGGWMAYRSGLPIHLAASAEEAKVFCESPEAATAAPTWESE